MFLSTGDGHTDCLGDRVRELLDSAPNCAKGEALRSGGGNLPGDGLPPPSLSGLVRKPSWTTKLSCIRETRCAKGREDGLSLSGSLCTTRGLVGALLSREIVGFGWPMSRSIQIGGNCGGLRH